MYNHENLPPVKGGTNGHLRPKPEGTTAACMAPVDTEWPYPEGWGKDPGATMPVKAGQFVTCLSPGDSYLNDEFEDTCSLTGVILDPKKDERAAELAWFWGDRPDGLKVLVVEARKTVGAIVVGEVADEAIGKELETAEGAVVLQKGDLVVISPRRADRPYAIAPENRKKRYAENGRVFPGDLPEQFR